MSENEKNNPKTARAAQQRQEEKKNNLLYGLIAVLVVVAVVGGIFWRSDFIPRSKNAATINGEKYSASEVAYYYQTGYRGFVNNYSYLISYLGLDTSSPLKDQEISKETASMLGLDVPAGGDAGDDTNAGSEADTDTDADASAEDTGSGITWHEYFIDQALNNIASIQTALKLADEQGFEYPASVQAQYDASMASLKSVASASGVSVSQYLKGSYGSGINEKIYGEQLMKSLKYSAFAEAYQKSLTYSDSELEEAYKASQNSYDLVSYEIASFDGTAPSTTDADGNTVEPTEEESAAALSEAQENAKALLEDVQNGGELEALSDQYNSTYTTQDAGTYSSSVTSEWLFDSARKEGDAAYLEDGTTQYVVVFRYRYRDEDPTIDIRHILVPLASATLTENDEDYDEEQDQIKADAHAKAEELLAQWQSGEATEDSFAALAMAESSDGSKYDGGLYTEVYRGQMVSEFNDWCFDSARKAGDTGVVDTQYGSHVMYFSGVDPLCRWQSQVASDLRSSDYADWSSNLSTDPDIQRNEAGLKYVNG